MPEISAKNLCLHYPVYGQRSHRLPNKPNIDNMLQTRFGHYLKALRDVSFNIQEGERVGLIGRNGSGKSTLLRVLGGIYTPTAGSLIIKGRTSSMFNIHLGIQQNATGRENIFLRGTVKGLRRREIQSKMEEIIAFSELDDFIDFPVRTYSTGMATRLSFSIATAFEHEILLLDEWIGAGDQSFQNKAVQRMNDIVAHAGITVIASHNRGLLKKVCTKLLWLHQGVICAYGDVDSVFAKMDAASS